MIQANSGRLIIDFVGQRLDSSDLDMLAQAEVGGAILFARNFDNRRQIKELVCEIRAVKPDALICVDQEGGRVQRFKEGFVKLPALQKIRKLVESQPQNTQEILTSLAWLMSAEILSTGVDISFAPVLDLDEDQSQVIGDRSLSDDPKQMTELASIYLQSMRDAGMATTGKHFPGHGGVRGDSHHEQPRDDRDLDALRKRDLIPFIELMPLLDAVMPAHVLYSQVDEHSPAGFSKRWLQTILRQEMGFQGVIFSDDLSMEGAASAGNGVDRARAAIDAGCDLLLVCNDRPMAEQVLDWMKQEDIPGSDAALRMRTQNDLPSESEIIEHKNYKLALEYIKQIEERFSLV